MESSRTFEQEYSCLFLFIQVLIILVSFKTGEHCTTTHVGGLIRAAECQTQLKVQAVGSSVSQSPSGTKLQKSAKNLFELSTYVVHIFTKPLHLAHSGF